MQFHQLNTVEITGCSIINKHGAIHTNEVSDLTVEGSTISGHNDWGMQLHRSNALLDNNEISGNGNGVYVYSDAERPILVTLNNNRIINNNDQGIRVEQYGRVVANYNDLYGNNWDFYNNSAAWAEVDARYNWWGQTTTDSMNAGNNPKNIQKIWDYYDNNDYGFVNYGGWLDGSGGSPTAITSTGIITLINSTGVEVLNYESGDILYVRVEDADANGDGGTSETIDVTITSETEAIGETLTLTETGINSGIFEGSLGFQEAAANTGDGTLQVARGDKLTGSYADPADDFGNPVEVTDVAFYGVTLMSGSLYGPNTWTLANSPYLVTGDVTISSEGSLTIEPGVEVRFVPSSDDLNSGNDVNRSELYVYGTLIAEGTESDHIIFTSNSENPSSGDWYGIYFRDYSADLSMSYCDLSYSTFGLYFSSMWRGDEVDTIGIYNSSFHDMGNAIREYHQSNRYYEVVGNHIYDC